MEVRVVAVVVTWWLSRLSIVLEVVTLVVPHVNPNKRLVGIKKNEERKCSPRAQTA